MSFTTNENYFGEKTAGQEHGPPKERLWKGEWNNHCLPKTRILTGIPESSLSLLPSHVLIVCMVLFYLFTVLEEAWYNLPDLHLRVENM